MAKLTQIITLGYNSYFTLLVTSLLAIQNWIKGLLTFEIGYKFIRHEIVLTDKNKEITQ